LPRQISHTSWGGPGKYVCAKVRRPTSGQLIIL